MLNEQCYNRMKVVEMVSQYISPILDNDKVEIIINNLWSGPFKILSTSSILTMINVTHYQYLYQRRPVLEIEENIIDNPLLFLRSPFTVISTLKEEFNNIKGVLFFQFQNWRSSIGANYIIDGLLNITLSIIVQIYVSDLLNQVNDVKSVYAQLEAYQAQVLDSTLMPLQKFKIAEEAKIYLDENIDIIIDTYHSYKLTIHL